MSYNCSNCEFSGDIKYFYYYLYPTDMQDERFRSFYNIEFVANKGENLYVMNTCIDCRLKYNKAYREANRDKIRERKKVYYETNRDKIKAYYETNRDKAKAYYEANKDRILEQRKAYREANRDKIREQKKRILST